MRTDDYKLIEQYLRGELDEAGVQALQSRMQSDEAFAEEVRFQQEIQSFVGHREKRQALQEQLMQLKKKEQSEAKVIPLRRKIFYVAGAAAAIALVIYLALPLLMPGSLYDQFNDHQPLALQQRGDHTTLVNQATEAFNSGDYPLAYAKLTDLLKANPEDSRTQLALGITALETDQLDEAKTIFETLSNGETGVKNNATWYLALTYVKLNDHARARETLQRIPEGTFWADKAAALLKALS